MPDMAQEASERACDRCRERRVKCDKRQPACLRCEKLGKPCPGYDKKRKFVDEGVTLRRKFQSAESRQRRDEGGQQQQQQQQQQPAAGSSNKPTAISPVAVPPLSRPLSGDSPFDIIRSRTTPSHSVVQPFRPSPSANEARASKADGACQFDVRAGSKTAPTLPVDMPQLNPLTEAMLLAGPAAVAAAPPDLAADENALLDELWNNGTFDPQWFDLDPVAYYGDNNNSCGFLPNVPNIVNEVDHNDVLMSTEPSATPLSTGLGTFSDSNLWAPESQLYTSALLNDEREHEMAYLIRHFTESLGPWMDLFDKDRHFTQLVPLQALRDALLRNAIAAVAAKQLGRLKGVRPFKCIQSQKPSTMEVLEDVVDVDWFYKAANYYDKAIAYSRQYLQAVSGKLSQPPSPNTQASLPLANSDDLLVAVSIFSLYESLDNLDVGWMQHLAGLKSLILATNADEQASRSIPPPLMVGRRASFWNFARADYKVSYTKHQYTLLDTDDLALWRRNGLQIQPDGSLYKSVNYVKSEPMYSRTLTELVSQSLLYLVLKVMNYLASEHDESPAARQAQWEQLTRQLDQWFSHLPATFQPVAQVRHLTSAAAVAAVPQHHEARGAGAGASTSTSGGRSLSTRLTETFFSIDVCAAGLQLYHFTRILLLLHRPPSKDTARAWGSRLKAYREVSGEALKHAHEIVGIALGRPTAAIRVEMLLPLSTAGSCLEADDERHVVLELLRAIEQDTGYSTEAHCQELAQEWGWATEPEGIA